MKKAFVVILVILVAVLLFVCIRRPAGSPLPEETQQIDSSETQQPVLTPTPEVTSAPEVTSTPEPTPTPTPTPEPTPTPQPEHSALYIPGVSVEDVIVYFNEVCLDSEFVNAGDPSLVQKWVAPVCFTFEGDYTDEDLAVLQSFMNWLNGVEGFPGISRTEDPLERNLRIYICSQQELLERMGPDFEYMDGAVRYWYMDNEIYDGIICVRHDLSQTLRNSVILEEIYNGLGPVQDTNLRPDSLIYQAYSEPQWLTAVDELILRLLYHPEIRPGMNAQECEQVIRRLYY